MFIFDSSKRGYKPALTEPVSRYYRFPNFGQINLSKVQCQEVTEPTKTPLLLVAYKREPKV